MLYYRFRPLTEFSLKELMYNEMYFASPEECNDPFDSKTYYSFKNDVEKWVNLVLFALAGERTRINLTGERLKAFTDHFLGKCPLSFDDIISRDLLADFQAKDAEEEIIKKALAPAIRKIVQLYQPSTRYFVSFSRDAKEPLMWAHYANKHKGFCLIFRSINNKIKQFPFRKRRQVRRKTPYGFSEQMSFGLPDEFEFTDIEYVRNVTPSNAFLHMPVAVTGDAKNDKHRDLIWAEQQKHYSQKGKSWEYEKESRLILPPPLPWLAGQHIEYTSRERLFHYDPSHLVGIIYGSRMTEDERIRVSEIIAESKEWMHYYPNYKRIEFGFAEFTATLSSKEREVIIEPVSITLGSTATMAGDKGFSRLFKEWQEGRGMEFDGTKATTIKVD